MQRARVRGIQALKVAFAATVLAVGGALVANGGPAEAAFPGANGKIVYHTAGFKDYEVAAVNPDGTGETKLTRNYQKTDVRPSWSADGSKVVFLKAPYNSPNDAFDIYTMNADGTDQRRLTDTPGVREESPAWSPDGEKIVFEVEEEVDPDPKVYIYESDLYMMNAGGSDLTRLTTNVGHDYDPDWSPDGTKIVFGSERDGRYGVYTMAPAPEGETNQPRRLPGRTGYDFDWSPDGQKIALRMRVGSDGHDSEYAVFTMNADGTERTRLTSGSTATGSPAWSPDGRKVAFGYGGNIYVKNAVPTGDTNKSQVVVDFPGAGAYAPDWQPLP